MTVAWIAPGSTNVEAMVNPLIAACDRGVRPDELYLIGNPEIRETIDRAGEIATTAVTAYGGEEPEIHVAQLETEVNFERIRTHIRDTIAAVQDDGGEVAVDITPGRKFMSAIAFAAGLRYEADHVFYLYVSSGRYYGRLYPDLPRTATHLYDFTEE